MIEHMQLGDMQKFCESVKTWLSDRYGARLINAIFQNKGKKDNQNAAAQYEITKDENGFLVSRKI